MTLVIPLHIEVTSLSSIVRRGFFMIFAPAGKICGSALALARDVAFPYVLWLLFGTGPRSRPMRYISRQHESGTTEPSGWSEDRKKAPTGYDGAGE